VFNVQRRIRIVSYFYSELWKIMMNKRMRPTCLARGEECRGTCGQPQRYSLHASPVQRSNNPVTPSLTTKMLTQSIHTDAVKLKLFPFVLDMSYVCSLGWTLVGRRTEKDEKKKAKIQYRNYVGAGGPSYISSLAFLLMRCTCSTLSDIERILIKVCRGGCYQSPRWAIV